MTSPEMTCHSFTENRGVREDAENRGFRMFIIFRENAENRELLTTDLL